MGRARVCDRCGKFYISNIGKNERTLGIMGKERIIYGIALLSDGANKPFDLCNDCINLLIDDFLRIPISEKLQNDERSELYG